MTCFASSDCLSFNFGDYASFVIGDSDSDAFTVSDISKAVYEMDAVKFAKASFDQLPYEAVALPFGVASAIYIRLVSPWRHERWPYSEAQAKWRQRMGVKLSPPYYPTKRFLPLLAVAWALDKFRKVFKNKSE